MSSPSVPSTTKRAKRGAQDRSRDRISDLPKNVIDHILQHLPIIDAARMSVLSTTWKSHWLSVPRLVFDIEFSETIDSEDYDFDDSKWSSIISNILLLHEGPIIEFSLYIPYVEDSSHIEITQWISFVSRNGVKRLSLVDDDCNRCRLRLPSNFFSFMGLESLSLDHCVIGRHSRYFRGLRNLLSLVVCDIDFEASKFKEFIACCPVLENLRMSRCYTSEPIIINLTNLKSFQAIHFKNASSLLSVKLGLTHINNIDVAEMMKYLASLRGLQRLCLCEYAYESLADSDISRILPTTFKHLKTLNLSWFNMNCMSKYLCAVGIIRSCPYVEELEVDLTDTNEYLVDQELEILENEANNDLADLEYTLNHLRSIRIRKVRGLAPEMRLISSLLASSPSLERLSLTCHDTVDAYAKSNLYGQMLRFRRASPLAKVRVSEIK